mmetsp:Transcript_50657/g.115107  ORF Transcript_50657/g.115107 Transcript_50657/m.115107 type:complete len:1176 (-) Transcript_50657:192-3719(-)
MAPNSKVVAIAAGGLAVLAAAILFVRRRRDRERFRQQELATQRELSSFLGRTTSSGSGKSKGWLALQRVRAEGHLIQKSSAQRMWDVNRQETKDVKQEDPVVRALKECMKTGFVKARDEKGGSTFTKTFNVQGKECKFTVEAPGAFAQFRKRIRLQDKNYYSSLIGELRGGVVQESGKSGALFWFTGDRKYILKTIERCEVTKLIAMLEDYGDHLEFNESSLLSRYYAVYSFSYNDEEFLVVAMNNVFQTGVKLNFVYDLKGTTEDRYVAPEPKAVLKDLNFADKTLRFAEERTRRHLVHRIHNDAYFLARQNIMDYSIILGVHYLDDGEKAQELIHKREGDVAEFATGLEALEVSAHGCGELEVTRRVVLFLGIIDMLQPYNLKKRAANLVKGWTIGWLDQIDTMPPEYYAKRFARFFQMTLQGSNQGVDSAERRKAIEQFAEQAEAAMKKREQMRAFPERSVSEAIRYVCTRGGRLIMHRTNRWGLTTKLEVRAILNPERMSVYFAPADDSNSKQATRILGFDIWSVDPSMRSMGTEDADSKDLLEPPFRSFLVLAFGQSLRFEAHSRELMKTWVTALEALDRLCSSSHRLLNVPSRALGDGDLAQYRRGDAAAWQDYVARKVMCACDEDGSNSLDWSEISEALDLLSVDPDQKSEARAIFESKTEGGSECISEQLFAEMLLTLFRSKNQATCFQKLCAKWDLTQFAVNQGETGYTDEDIRDAEADFGAEPGKSLPHSQWTPLEYARMIRSARNTLVDIRHQQQKLDKPITEYWIATSHNTYLEDSQIFGQTAGRMYVRALNSGCRCVELDVWDDGETPVVTHGHTGSTSLSFKAICQTIQSHAFAKSPYPLILSIEQHCSEGNLTRQAEILREIFGDSLLTPELDAAGNVVMDQHGNPSGCLPTPEEGKHRIICKSKLTGLREYDTLIAMPTKKGDFSDLNRSQRQCLSFSEKKAIAFLAAFPRQQVQQFTSQFLTRSYPAGLRVTSSNPNPVPHWAAGIHMVALNYQTMDEAIMINAGLFNAHHRLGYVQKPDSVLHASTRMTAASIAVHVVAGHRLPKPRADGKHFLCPQVRVIIVDHQSRSVRDTHAIQGNGFNPVWDARLDPVEVTNLECAHIIFQVLTTGAQPVCYFAAPLSAVRRGFRTVPLYGALYGAPVKHSGLVVKVTVQPTS